MNPIPEQKMRIAISHCLLGKSVRYDGQHKLDRYLVGSYSNFFEWVPFCPEAESGMGIPREAMRLEGDPEAPRLMTRRTRIDKTEQLLSWSIPRVKQMANENLCGIILKKGSPSCGLYGIRPLTEKGMPGDSGPGLFAREVIKQHPYLPMEEEGRLHDPTLREIFVEKVFVFGRWKDLLQAPSVKALTLFHQRHKYLLMARSPEKLKELGRMVAESTKSNLETTLDQYFTLLMETLSLKGTLKKHRNVLQHIMGYFKKDLSPDEKQELLEEIDLYCNELVPLIVPITLLKHYIRKYQQPYLLDQYYIQPHPKELMIRNQV
jgi:uncharacterized protein YbgA (DUF1722 family)/uncharacterized protein YbbK (DUF523 family)